MFDYGQATVALFLSRLFGGEDTNGVIYYSLRFLSRLFGGEV